MIRETTDQASCRRFRPLPLPPRVCAPLRKEGIISILLCYAEDKTPVVRESDDTNTGILFIIQKGTMRLTIGERRYTVKPGQTILFSESLSRRWEQAHGNIFQAIRARIVLDSQQSYRGIELPAIADSTENAPITLLAEACYLEATRPAPRPEALFHYSATLACHFRRELANLGSSSDSESLRKLENLWSEVRQNLQRKWTVQDFASLLHVSRTCVFEWVNEHYGVSPMAYLTSLRINRACQQLSISDITLDELAAELGYCSPYAFSNAFKRVIGIRPSEWRRKEASYL